MTLSNVMALSIFTNLHFGEIAFRCDGRCLFQINADYIDGCFYL